tara:strand:+ start:353 stop:979 length:627 start_codon:yes stop_codon:yes gene_type:complete
MQSRSISRELALLLLGQISENNLSDLDVLSIEKILNKALDTLMDHWREELDFCANQLEIAQDELRDSEFKDIDKNRNQIVRMHLKNCLIKGEDIINSLSETIELSRLLTLSDQAKIRTGAIQRVLLVTQEFQLIDSSLDKVMEGWRLKRLPRIDRDILRLAFVDLNKLNIPTAVACNEAVNLANRYSDENGRRMINGILRRIQNNSSF